MAYSSTREERMMLRKAHTFKSLKRVGNSFVLSPEQLQFYRKNGFLIIEKFLKKEVVDGIASRFETLFAGDFDTGVYPDEWYGRTGMHVPGVTREICNIWKADSYLARNIMLSEQIHSIIAQLHGWSSSRIAQDDILWKPAKGGSAVGFHRDSAYISEQFLPLPENSVTAWMPLDDVSLESGSIEYVTGSHRWGPITSSLQGEGKGSFHFVAQSHQHREQFTQSIFGTPTATARTPQGEVVLFEYAEIPRGAIAFHHQDLYHGSGINITRHTLRRAMVLHAINGDCRFNENREADYIYGRYRLCDENGALENKLHEKFFPVCWSALDFGSAQQNKEVPGEGSSTNKKRSYRPTSRSKWIDPFFFSKRFSNTNLYIEGDSIFFT